jgi:hypothetical protein
LSTDRTKGVKTSKGEPAELITDSPLQEEVVVVQELVKERESKLFSSMLRISRFHEVFCCHLYLGLNLLPRR